MPIVVMVMLLLGHSVEGQCHEVVYFLAHAAERKRPQSSNVVIMFDDLQTTMLIVWQMSAGTVKKPR